MRKTRSSPSSAALRKGREGSKVSICHGWRDILGSHLISKASLLNTTCLYLQPLYELTKMRSNDGFLCSRSHKRDFVFSFQELNLRRLSALFLTSFVQWALLISDTFQIQFPGWLLAPQRGDFLEKGVLRAMTAACLPACEVTQMCAAADKWFQSFPPETRWLKVIKSEMDNLAWVLWLLNDNSMKLEESVTFTLCF